MKKNLFKKILSLVLVSTMLFITACSNTNTAPSADKNVVENVNENEATEEEQSKTHLVIDHLDKTVEVPNEINRVVVTDIYPLVSVLSIFFDSADKIVGMAPPSMVAAKNSILTELYPSLLNAKTDFINGANLNIEELLKLSPDIVIYPASSPAEGEQLAKAGIPAVSISVNKWDYNAIETLNNWISLLDDVFMANDKADKVREYSEKIYEDVQNRIASLSEEEQRKAFFLFQYSDTNIMTSGKNFFGNWWAEAIGAKNVAVELEKDNSVSVNMEQIYKWNPDLIYITNFNTATPDDLYNNTVGTYDWSEVDAVKNKQCFKMPLGMYRTYTPGVDTPITLYFLAKIAYPDLFKDVDMSSEVKNYYKDVFGINLTDEQVNKIFNPSVNAGAGFSNGK